MDEQIESILATAFENAWWINLLSTQDRGNPEKEYLSEVLAGGGVVTILDDQNEFHTLTLSQAREGFLAGQQHYGLSAEEFVEQHDADMADYVLQYALYGEIIYG